LNLTVKLTWCTSNVMSGSHPAGDTIAFDRKTFYLTDFFLFFHEDTDINVQNKTDNVRIT